VWEQVKGEKDREGSKKTLQSMTNESNCRSSGMGPGSGQKLRQKPGLSSGKASKGGNQSLGGRKGPRESCGRRFDEVFTE